MGPTQLPTPQPGGNQQPTEHDEEPERGKFTVAGHVVSKRDIILTGIAGGLLLFGVVLGTLGIFGGRPTTDNTAAPDDGKEVVDKADLLNHQWSYLPGAVREKDGLRIIPDGFTITKADGTAQSNPPLNLYGTHLEEVRDIVITAGITPGTGPLSLRLYTEPPLIGTNFREERKSIDLGVTGNVLSISTWDRAEPATNTYTFEATDKLTLSVKRQNRVLTFSVNDKQVATLPEGNIFSSGKLWFGTNATVDAWTLNSLRAEALSGTRVTVVDATKATSKNATDSLQVLANIKRQGFSIGAVMGLSPLVTDGEYRGIALGQFGSLTPDTAMQWQAVHPASNDYDFAEADALADIAKKGGLAMHGSSLLSNTANPPWVTALPVTTDAEKQATEAVMNDHIKTVTEHFAGKVASWDVIDMPFVSQAEFDQGQLYRQNKWFQAMGKDYIAKALNAAKTADENAQLFINEYGLERDGPRWDAFVAMVSDLKKQGVPLTGVGMKAVVPDQGSVIDTAVLRKHIQQLKALDIKVRISGINVFPGNDQISQYANVLDTCLQEVTCVSYTTAGVSSRYNYFKDGAGALGRADTFIYDNNVKPTAAATALRELLTR